MHSFSFEFARSMYYPAFVHYVYIQVKKYTVCTVSGAYMSHTQGFPQKINVAHNWV